MLKMENYKCNIKDGILAMEFKIYKTSKWKKVCSSRISTAHTLLRIIDWTAGYLDVV